MTGPDSASDASGAAVRASHTSASSAEDERDTGDRTIADGRRRAGTTRVATLEAFRYRDFQLLWTGTLFNTIATWIQITTLGWLAYSLTGSGATLGAVIAMRFMPTLLLTPLAGVASDRYTRNQVIGASQIFLVGVTFLFAVDIAAGAVQVWHLFAFTLLAGAAFTFNQPARQAFVFDLVPEHVVPNAVAASNVAQSSGRMLSAAGAGAMIVAFGAAANFFVQSLAYVCILGTVLLIRTPRRARSGQPRPTVWSGIIEGFGYSRRNPQMRLLLLMSAINPVFYIPIHDALMPIFAASALPGGAQTLGLLLGALGAGGLLGGIVTASLSHVDRRGLMQLVALLVHGLSLASFSVAALVTHQLWLALSILLISGIAESLHLATNQTVVQLLAPDHLRGRVTSILQFSMVLNAIGVFGAGVLADHVGPTGAGIALSLSGFVLTASILIGSSKMRTLRLSQLKELGQKGLRPAAPGG